MVITQIIIYAILIYILYKPEIIPDEISKDNRRIRILTSVVFVTLLIYRYISTDPSGFFGGFFGNNAATLWFWLAATLLAYILYKPEIIPNKIFYNSHTKTYTWAGKSRSGKRVFVILCSCCVILPLYFWMSNENYKVREAEIREIEIKREIEVAKLKKIVALEVLGVSNASLLSEEKHDIMLDSIENKNCKEKYLEYLANEFGIKNPNLRETKNKSLVWRKDNYDINKDCKFAQRLYNDLVEKKELEAKERRENPCYDFAGKYSGSMVRSGYYGSASMTISKGCRYTLKTNLGGGSYVEYKGRVVLSENALHPDNGVLREYMDFYITGKNKIKVHGYGFTANMSR